MPEITPRDRAASSGRDALTVEVSALLDVWGADRRVAHMLRDQVRAAWPEVGQRLDDLLETRDEAPASKGVHCPDWCDGPECDHPPRVGGACRPCAVAHYATHAAASGDTATAPPEEATGDATHLAERLRRLSAWAVTHDWRSGEELDLIADDLTAAFSAGRAGAHLHGAAPASDPLSPEDMAPAADPAPTYRREEPRRVGQVADPATDLADVERLIAEAPADYPGLPLLHRRRDELAAATTNPADTLRQIREITDTHPDAPVGELLGEVRRLVDNDDHCTATHHSTPPDVAGLLLACAAGRREYAQGAPETTADLLLHEAVVWEQAAQITRGDYSALWGALSSWRWTPGMDRSVRAGAPRGALTWADVAGVVERSADVVPDPDPAPADPDA